MTVRYNNALQLTRGASEASGLRRTRQSLVPLAAERECSLYQARSPIEITTAGISWMRQS